MDERQTDLERLVDGVARGDRISFRKLYDATSPKLFGIILRICKDRGMAEDVLQEAFLRVWRKAGDYDPASGRPLTWIIAIGRNAAIDALRQRRAAAARFEEVDDERLSAMAAPDGDPIHPLDRDALAECLGKLEEQQRLCVLLAYRDGYSREELGLRFDRPVGTIKTWLHRSLARLKDCLERT